MAACAPKSRLRKRPEDGRVLNSDGGPPSKKATLSDSTSLLLNTDMATVSCSGLPIPTDNTLGAPGSAIDDAAIYVQRIMGPKRGYDKTRPPPATPATIQRERRNSGAVGESKEGGGTRESEGVTRVPSVRGDERGIRMQLAQTCHQQRRRASSVDRAESGNGGTQDAHRGRDSERPRSASIPSPSAGRVMLSSSPEKDTTVERRQASGGLAYRTINQAAADEADSSNSSRHQPTTITSHRTSPAACMVVGGTSSTLHASSPSPAGPDASRKPGSQAAQGGDSSAAAGAVRSGSLASGALSSSSSSCPNLPSSASATVPDEAFAPRVSPSLSVSSSSVVLPSWLKQLSSSTLPSMLSRSPPSVAPQSVPLLSLPSSSSEERRRAGTSEPRGIEAVPRQSEFSVALASCYVARAAAPGHPSSLSLPDSVSQSTAPGRSYCSVDGADTRSPAGSIKSSSGTGDNSSPPGGITERAANVFRIDASATVVPAAPALLGNRQTRYVGPVTPGEEKTGGGTPPRTETMTPLVKTEAGVSSSSAPGEDTKRQVEDPEGARTAPRAVSGGRPQGDAGTEPSCASVFPPRTSSSSATAQQGDRSDTLVRASPQSTANSRPELTASSSSPHSVPVEAVLQSCAPSISPQPSHASSLFDSCFASKASRSGGEALSGSMHINADARIRSGAPQYLISPLSSASISASSPLSTAPTLPRSSRSGNSRLLAASSEPPAASLEAQLHSAEERRALLRSLLRGGAPGRPEWPSPLETKTLLETAGVTTGRFHSERWFGWGIEPFPTARVLEWRLARILGRPVIDAAARGDATVWGILCLTLGAVLLGADVGELRAGFQRQGLPVPASFADDRGPAASGGGGESH
ncbi:hypothetical protein BESB_061240 [Besnoitia besnoiti]|uniref:Uncharacterized protein n=1 Tax=Besnoitia besnoiti TaxID=94643 RepID=A0A2A9MI17_BESBE|nr:hypothetical protein BESB_061240 [Besnoitia besnoiti]PFH35237.1 hypothetical protein BESB_061240 [Besnoitia besnoiti]